MIFAENAKAKVQRRPYPAIFYKDTGKFIRGDDPKTGKDPFMAPELPEMLDISITGACNGPNGKNCAFCYRKATPDGVHMDVADYQMILDQLVGHFVCQIAIGGGNPPAHPEFAEILRRTYEAGIIPNYTYNGMDLDEAKLEATAAYCGAVAVSEYFHRTDTGEGLCYSQCNRLIDAGVKTNIHFVLSNKTINVANSILDGYKHLPIGLNAIVFLTHKAVGNGTDEDLLDPKSEEFIEFQRLLKDSAPSLPFKIGFDSCFASGLSSITDIDPVLYDYCEAGRFSAFINEHCEFYPCSFTEESTEGINLLEVSLHDAWQLGASFQEFREYLGSEERCKGCKHREICSPCPIARDDVLCNGIVEDTDCEEHLSCQNMKVDYETKS